MIAGATLLLGSYVIGVLWHAQAVPEIGFQFVFRPVIDRYDATFIDPAFSRITELNRRND